MGKSTCRWFRSKRAASEAVRPKRAASSTLAAKTHPDSGRSRGGGGGVASTSIPCSSSGTCADQPKCQFLHHLGQVNAAQGFQPHRCIAVIPIAFHL